MPELLIKSGVHQGKRLVLPQPEVIIGREPECQIRIGSSDVSRRHCQLFITDEGIKIRDLGSQNGTIVNDLAIEGEVLLNPGDEIRVGPMIFQIPAKKKTESKFVLPTANWPAYINCLRAYLEQDYDLRDTLHQVFVPTTVLVGLKSQMYPKGGQLRIADYREGARTIGLPRSGHTPLIDQPWQFFSILKSFVHDEDIALASS